MKVSVVRNILEANERIAEQNRALFNENHLLVVNLMSSPGAGKTSLLERTIERLRQELRAHDDMVKRIEKIMQTAHRDTKYWPIREEGTPGVTDWGKGTDKK